jgi:hypothetical protein
MPNTFSCLTNTGVKLQGHRPIRVVDYAGFIAAGSCAGDTFTATTRWAAVWNAFQTPPTPPRRNNSTNRYRPKGVPSTMPPAKAANQ